MLLCAVGSAKNITAQLILSGTVYDAGKINLVEGVRIVSTGGLFGITDSMGRYKIMVAEKDSVFFNYQNKPTQKFAVKSITDLSNFNIALQISIKGKYSTMKEVFVYSKTYRQDSIENRNTYADIFDYKKPGIQTGISPDGVAGMDIDELINMFRFKRNRHLRAFQVRLEEQEKEKYITNRFNKTLVRRITHLQAAQLDSFMVHYRPSYELVSKADEIAFNQYILNAFYQYKIDLQKQAAKKD